MKTLVNETQVLNIHYRQESVADLLNHQFYKLFTPGVISGIFTFSSDAVTISSLSLLIRPQNLSDLLVRVDTTEEIIKTKSSPTDIYFVARFRWESAITGVIFTYADDINKLPSDVILVGLTTDQDGKIQSLNYDVQDRACLKVIQHDTAFPLVSKLDGYYVGHSSGEIPISDGDVNIGLSAEYLNGQEVTDFVASKGLSTTVIQDDREITIGPEVPSWMDSDAVDLGTGVTAEFVNGKKVQPQDGTTLPGEQDQIPIANDVLQKNLNAEYLSGRRDTEFAKATHLHSLDDITDGGVYYRVVAVSDNLATADSIDDGAITYAQVDHLTYDVTNNNWFKPVYETGIISLTGVAATTVNFARSMANVRVILQREPASGEGSITAGCEKRTARITSITTTSFLAKQMGSIIKSGSDYIRNDANDAGANRYAWLAIGEAI